jgi:membrane associated rhomboid family serine protease
MGYSTMFGGPATWAVKRIIIANVVVFALQTLSELLNLGIVKIFDGRYVKVPVLDYFLGLNPDFVTHKFMIWQFASYMFLHGGILHILINMFMLYMFGNELERLWGTGRFIRYYFITGIGAGVCSWIVGINNPAITIGASGAIYGVLLAYGITFPNRIVYLNFLFPIKVKWMVLIFGAIAFYSSLGGSNSGIAHIAHLGGMVVGYIYLRGKNWRNFYKQYEARMQHEKLKRQFEVYYGDVRRKIEEDKKKKGPTIH